LTGTLIKEHFMNRLIVAAVACLGIYFSFWPAISHADDDAAKEAHRLEGVWKSKPTAKGRGRGHVLYIEGGKLGWDSFQTRDGEKIIGHAKLYELTVDPKAKPKKMTLTFGKGEDRTTRFGVYELDGETLKLAFASPSAKEPPKTVSDEDAETLILTRDKAAKLPKLDQPVGEEIQITPIVQWAGVSRDPDLKKKCPEGPVVSQTEFETVWKALRGDELTPKVDFTGAFVQIRSGGLGKFPLVGTGLTLDPAGKLGTMSAIGHREVDGTGYVIAVFQRDVVDAVDGKIVPKQRK
jgi:uncharacterized protein (TIGR03067 family)